MIERKKDGMRRPFFCTILHSMHCTGIFEKLNIDQISNTTFLEGVWGNRSLVTKNGFPSITLVPASHADIIVIIGGQALPVEMAVIGHHQRPGKNHMFPFLEFNHGHAGMAHGQMGAEHGIGNIQHAA